MLELELTKADCTLEALTCRTEKHGKDDVPAVTLKLSTSQPSAVLAFFSPTLEAHLFDKSEKDLLGEVLRLRYPHIEYPLKLDHTMTGADLAIDFGIGAPMEYDGVTVDDFRVTPIEGGSVALVFNAGFRCTEEHIGKLYVSQKRKLTLSLEPAELPEMKDAA